MQALIALEAHTSRAAICHMRNGYVVSMSLAVNDSPQTASARLEGVVDSRGGGTCSATQPALNKVTVEK